MKVNWMEDFTINEMQDMQRALQERYKDPLVFMER